MKHVLNRWMNGIVLGSLLTLSLLVPRPAMAQSEPLLGQLMLVGFNFCPRGWARAEGQLLAISNWSALFSLFGTTYGGDGRTTFGVPDLRGRAPIHEGQGPGLNDYRRGEKGGTESFTLTENQMPLHNHEVNATNLFADKPGPGGKLLAADNVAYVEPESGGIPVGNQRVMDPSMISYEGSSQSVAKRSPYLAMTWCVALTGVYPSRS